MFKPRTLSNAYSLTNLQEATLEAVRKKGRPFLNANTGRFGVGSGLGVSNKPPLLPLPAPNNEWKNKPNTTTRTPMRKQLTQREYEEKKAKNLCFYCHQKFVTGHKCEGDLFSIVVLGVDEEPEEEFVDAEEYLMEAVQDLQPHISLNAFTGVSSYQTMRVIGIVANKYKLHILVDLCSTHNFLDINMAKRMGCNIRQTRPLSVSVAGGKQLISSLGCKNFT